MKYIWEAGSTNRSTFLFFNDTTSTTGGGKTGLLAGQISGSYSRMLYNSTVEFATIGLSNLASLSDAWVSGGFEEVHSALAPGLYRLDIPNVCLATGAVQTVISLVSSGGVATIAPLMLEIQFDPPAVNTVEISGLAQDAVNIGPQFTYLSAQSVLNNNLSTAISGYTDDIGVGGSGLFGVPWGTTWDASMPYSRMADNILRRDQANIFASTYGDALSPNSQYGFVQQAQESYVSGLNLYIKNTDGSALGTIPISVSPTGNPIIGIGT